MKRILVSLALIVFAFGLLTPTFASVPRAEKIGINVRASWTGEEQLGTNKIVSYISTISQTKVGFVRVFIPWNFIQPQAKKDAPSHQWNWNKIDLMVDTITAEGMEPLLVLHNQPAWATQATTSAESDNYLPYKIPWKNFIAALINRYGYVQGGRQQVQYWEILNEPDAPGRNYTHKQYGEFLKFTYPIIKSLDPQAKVLNGGLTQLASRTDRGEWLNKFLSYNHAEFANYFDFFSTHQYGKVDDMDDIVVRIKNIFHDWNITKPIWVTETNLGSNVYTPQISPGPCNPAGEETKYLVFKTLFDNILNAGAGKVFLLSAACTPWAGPGIFVRESGSAGSAGLVLIQNTFAAFKKDVSTFITPTPTPTPIPGDLDHDNDVDNEDWNKMKEDFGKTGNAGWIPADIIKNGKVDIFDYNILVENFGK